MKSEHILKTFFSPTEKLLQIAQKKKIHKKTISQIRFSNQEKDIIKNNKFDSANQFDDIVNREKLNSPNNKSNVNSQFMRKIIYDSRILQEKNMKLQTQLNKEKQKSLMYKKMYQELVIKFKTLQNFQRTDRKQKIQQEMIGLIHDLSQINLKQIDNLQQLQIGNQHKKDILESENLLLMIQNMKNIDKQYIKPIELEFEKTEADINKTNIQQERKLKIKLENQVKMLQQKISDIQKLLLQKTQKIKYLTEENSNLKQKVLTLNENIITQKDRMSKIRYLLNTNENLLKNKYDHRTNQQQYSYRN